MTLRPMAIRRERQARIPPRVCHTAMTVSVRSHCDPSRDRTLIAVRPAMTAVIAGHPYSIRIKQLLLFLTEKFITMGI